MFGISDITGALGTIFGGPGGGVLGSLAGGVLGNVFADRRQEDQQKFNAEQAQNTMAFNAQQAAEQRDWAANQAETQRDWSHTEAQYDQFFQKQMSDTAIQRRVQDLTAAGINPLLAWQGGGATTPGGAMGSSSIPSGSTASAGMASSGIASPTPFHDFAASMASATQAQLNEKGLEARAAEIDRTKAEADEIRARTPTYAVNIDATRQQIEESKSRILNLIQNTETSAATARNLAQQTENLQAVLPQIKAHVDNLKAMTIQSLTAAGLNEQHAAEVKQRIDANLPRLQNAVLELDRQSKILAMPTKEMQSDVTGQGYLGALSATLHALNPFSDFMKK